MRVGIVLARQACPHRYGDLGPARSIHGVQLMGLGQPVESRTELLPVAPETTVKAVERLHCLVVCRMVF